MGCPLGQRSSYVIILNSELLLNQVCRDVDCHLRPQSLCLIHPSPFCPTGSTRCQLQLGNIRTWWILEHFGWRKFGPMWKAPYIFTLVLFGHIFFHLFFWTMAYCNFSFSCLVMCPPNMKNCCCSVFCVISSMAWVPADSESVEDLGQIYHRPN